MSKKEEKQEELQEEMEAVDAAGVSEVEVEATEIENLKAELSEMEDKFLRARAEIANMSNRNKNERELLVRYRSQDLGKKILPSIDNLERAMAIEVSDEQGESLKKGISMVLESITVALKEEGISNVSLIAFTQNDIGNAFWNTIGWNERQDLNYYDFVLNTENITAFNAQ